MCTHVVVEEEDPTEEAEEVSGEQGEVDGGGAAKLYHYRHEAVQSIHTQCIGSEQQSWEETWPLLVHLSIKEISNMKEKITLFLRSTSPTWWSKVSNKTSKLVIFIHSKISYWNKEYEGWCCGFVIFRKCFFKLSLRKCDKRDKNCVSVNLG